MCVITPKLKCMLGMDTGPFIAHFKEQSESCHHRTGYNSNNLTDKEGMIIVDTSDEMLPNEAVSPLQQSIAQVQSCIQHEIK